MKIKQTLTGCEQFSQDQLKWRWNNENYNYKRNKIT